MTCLLTSPYRLGSPGGAGGCRVGALAVPWLLGAGLVLVAASALLGNAGDDDPLLGVTAKGFSRLSHVPAPDR